MSRKRQLTIEERQTITLKNVGLSYRNCEESQGVSEYSFLHHQKALRNWGNSDRKRSGRLKTTKESEDKFLRVNSLIGGSQDNSFKQILVVVCYICQRLLL